MLRHTYTITMCFLQADHHTHVGFNFYFFFFDVWVFFFFLLVSHAIQRNRCVCTELLCSLCAVFKLSLLVPHIHHCMHTKTDIQIHQKTYRSFLYMWYINAQHFSPFFCFSVPLTLSLFQFRKKKPFRIHLIDRYFFIAFNCQYRNYHKHFL